MMDKDRWAKVAIEMQEHIDALERIAKREGLDPVSIALYGRIDEEYPLEASVSYLEDDDLYVSDSYRGGKLKIKFGAEEYKSFTKA